MRPQERFWPKVAAVGNVCECWTWQGACVKGGYGMFHHDNASTLAHRFAYERTIGAIPDGLELDHLCKNTGCVNPWHLEPVTHEENVRRSDIGKFQLAKTHCRLGHPYSGDNLFFRADGRRECRICMREQLRRSRVRARAAKC